AEGRPPYHGKPRHRTRNSWQEMVNQEGAAPLERRVVVNEPGGFLQTLGVDDADAAVSERRRRVGVQGACQRSEKVCVIHVVIVTDGYVFTRRERHALVYDLRYAQVLPPHIAHASRGIGLGDNIGSVVG